MRNSMTTIRYPSSMNERAMPTGLPTFSSLHTSINKPPSSIQKLHNEQSAPHHTHNAEQNANHTVTTTFPTSTAPHFSHPGRRWMPSLVPTPTACVTLLTVHRLPPLTTTACDAPPLRLKQGRHSPAYPVNMPSCTRPSAKSRTSFVTTVTTGKNFATPPPSRD